MPPLPPLPSPDSLLTFIPPAWLLAGLFALLNIFLFRLLAGRQGHTVLYFFPWGVFGFALGNLLASLASSILPTVGDVRIVEASLGAWALLAVANLRTPA